MMQSRFPSFAMTTGLRGRRIPWFVSLFLLAIAGACQESPSGPVTGALVVTIEGLPGGAQNVLSVTGAGYSRVMSVSDTLRQLTPGVYTVAANLVTHGGGAYVARIPSQQIRVEASDAPASVTVNFDITTGTLNLTVAGLPDGAPAAITISGPNGYARTVSQSSVLAGLQPGNYLISSASVLAPSGHTYSPVPLSQSIGIVASEAARNITANYALSTGSLDVAISGLPQGTAADVSVFGPGGFSRTLTANTTLVGLFPGSYTVQANNVGAGIAYAPNPPTSNIDVSPSLTPARVTIAYSELNTPPPAQFNLSIDGMYITQAVQNYAAGVPLIAGLPGLVRVFVRASASNSVVTSVRLRLYQGAALAETMTLMPNVPSVPTTVQEGTISATWNAIIPAFQIQPGLRILADVDPSNAVQESNESDNAFPASGIPLTPSVEFTAPLSLTIVPVLQAANGVGGNATNQNQDDFLTFARKVLPIKDYNVTLHSVVTTSAPVLASNDGNNAWFQILGEVNALRVAEGSSDYYLGVVGTTYSSGVVGLAFTPGRASVIWDKMPSASQIAAHELGHNLGRFHAPCGGVANPDASYPYALGTIGVYGYDIATGVLKSPGTSDLMGYCGFGWISDYNYVGILNYRRTTPGTSVMPAVAARAANGRESPRRETFIQSARSEPSLIVWGWIRDGVPVLEPAFTATTRTVLPANGGPHRIDALAQDGKVLFSYAFEGEEPDDVATGSARHFTFAIPVTVNMEQSIATLRVTTSSGARSERRLSGTPAGDFSSMEAVSGGPGIVRFSLKNPGARLAVVRERPSQRIVAFLRDQGPVAVRTMSSEFDVVFSDGVRSTRRTLRPAPR